MRRNDKEIKDPNEIKRLLQEPSVCRLAMTDGYAPYIVPVNFAVEGGVLYIHSAKTGKKIDILRNNPSVCFEMDIPGDLVEGERACQWGMKYKSLIGFGKAIFMESGEEKKKALDVLMNKYAGRGDFSYADEALDKVLVIGIQIEGISGKKSG
jgi:uncharacterized protein